MDIYHKEASKYTPEITLDFENGVFEFVGKSYPENTFEFFQPVMDRIEKYFEQPLENTIFRFDILYFNSSSSKLFFDLFDLIEENKDSSKIVIEWIYDEENESSKESGEEFTEDFESLDFRLVERAEKELR